MRDLLDLYQKSDTVARLAELQDVVQSTLEELARTMGYDRAFVALVDVDQGTIEGVVGVNPPEVSAVAAFGPAEEPGPIVQSLRLGRPLHIDDALRDSRVPENERAMLAHFDLISFAAVPLPPASSVLVVSKNRPVSEAEINELLPYAARLVAKLAETGEAQRLRESGEQHAIEKEWLWWMLNAVQDPIVLSDEQNNIIHYNVYAERLLLARPEDSDGKRRAIELNNVLLSATLSSFTLDQGAALGRDLSLVDPIEGGELLFEVICQPATNLRTGQRGLVSVLKDVSDIRRALDELLPSLAELQNAGEEARQERDRLNLILGSVADPIVVTDQAGKIVLMNQPAERLLQSRYGPSNPRSTIYLANDARLSSFLSQLGLEAAVAKQGEIQLVDPDTEEPLTMSVTATEIRDELGQVTAVVSALHDLTKIRELERRTVQQQLFESEKLAAVGRLAAAVAHEINNPLEAIKNSLYLLVSRTAENDPNWRFLEIANKETERVSGIIRQMLGFYRPVAIKTPADVNEVIVEAVALLERHLRQRHVAMRLDLDPDVPSVPASPDQLKQVFLNLILNAQDAMPDGGTLHISTRMARPSDTDFVFNGRWVLIQFRDTGIGISEENLRQIFEPFFSTKSEQKGTGLGLWVSMGIIQQHGGQMQVRSRPGRGSTFTIALPTEAQDG